MSLKVKDISKLVGGVAELVNSFLDDDAVEVGRDSDKRRTHVRLKGSSFGQEQLRKMNFGMDFEDERTRIPSNSDTTKIKRIK